MQHTVTFVILPYARSSLIFSPILAPTPLMAATSSKEAMGCGWDRMAAMAAKINIYQLLVFETDEQ
jgi:hypothetical protein